MTKLFHNWHNWQLIDTAPEGQEVWTKIDDENGVRNVSTLIRQKSLWWFPDFSMYVYYAPTHWAPKDDT